MTQSGNLYRVQPARRRSGWAQEFIDSLVSDTHTEPENREGNPLLGLILMVVLSCAFWGTAAYYFGPPLAREWHRIHQSFDSGVARIEFDLASASLR